LYNAVVVRAHADGFPGMGGPSSTVMRFKNREALALALADYEADEGGDANVE
jgi:hypothetical protein